MPEPLSRRSLLTKASIGAAGVAAGVAAIGPVGALISSRSAAASTASLGASAVAANDADLTPVGTDVVAHIRNASTGEVVIMVGTNEIAYHDRALVARMLSGARKAGLEA